MFNTILVSLSVLVVLAVGVFFGVFGRTIMKAIKEGLAERKVAQEVELDLPMMEKAGTYTTSDRKADVRWDGKGNLVSVGLRGGASYDSFEELFRVEKMDMKTYKELDEMSRRFEQVQKHMEEEMYKPSYRREYNTEKELGKKLYVYLNGKLRISDRILVFIEEIGGQKGISGAMIGADGLENSDAIRMLDFIAGDNHTQEEADKHQDAWSDYLDNPDYAAESKLVAELQDHLEFYNAVVKDGQVTFSGGRIFIKTPQVLTTQPVVTTQRSARREVEEALKNAQQFQSASK